MSQTISEHAIVPPSKWGKRIAIFSFILVLLLPAFLWWDMSMGPLSHPIPSSDLDPVNGRLLFLIMGWPSAAAILGGIAFAKVRRSPGHRLIKAMALVTLVLGIIEVLLSVLLFCAVLFSVFIVGM